MSVTVVLIPEEIAHRFQDKNYTLSVEGWSRKRTLHQRGPDLILEIAMKDCMCSTCIRRFETILFSMRDRGVSYEAGSWSGDCSIKFRSLEGFEESEICSFLSEQIGLAVSGLEEIPEKASEEQ